MKKAIHQPKKVLVVGGCGYIGSHLTNLLNSNQTLWDVTVFDKPTNMPSTLMEKVNIIDGDIKNTDILDTLIHKFDVVIWLAAIVGDQACETDEQLTIDINTLSVKWLVNNFKGKIVFTSTCAVYGTNINGDLLNESTDPNPSSLYASSKLTAEQYVLKNANNPLIFRLGTLYGQGSLHSKTHSDQIVNTLIENAVQGKPLAIYGGEQWHSLLHVNDVANAIVYGLENNIDGLFNLSSENYRLNEIVEEIRRVVPTLKAYTEDIHLSDTKNYKLDNSKYMDEGWIALHDLKEGILEIVNTFLSDQTKKSRIPIDPNIIHISTASELDH